MTRRKRTPDPWQDRIVGEGAEAPTDLLANPANWRIHPREQRRALAGVLDTVGWVQRVVVNRTTGHVIDGHLRVDLAIEREEPTVPVVYVELDADEEALILATLDPLAAMAGTDTDKADELAAALTAEHADLLAAVLEPEPIGDDGERAAPEEDVPEEPNPTPTTREGDLIELGPHRLYCGDTFDKDARAKLLAGAEVACVVTDPPYAIYGSSTGVMSDVADDKMVRPFFAGLFVAALESVKMFGHVYVWCDWRSWAAVWEGGRQAGAAGRNMLVWDKGSAGLGANYFNTYEMIGFFARLPRRGAMKESVKAGVRQVHRPNILRFDRVPGRQREHNAQKPVALIRELIENSTDEGEVVLDLFGGSGSTLIAAGELGRVAYVMEIDPGWCDVIVDRWERETGERAKRPRRRK